jgi:hypothetical protein
MSTEKIAGTFKNPLLIDSVRALPKKESYNNIAIKETYAPRTFNGIDGIVTRRIQIAGVKLIWDKNDSDAIVQEGETTKKLFNYSGSADIESLEMYADEVVIRSPLVFPQTGVKIYARKLMFEGDGSINTTPLPHQRETAATTRRDSKGRPLGGDGRIKAADGRHGLDGGAIELYVKEDIVGPDAKVRLIARGSNGQKAEDGGYLDYVPQTGQSSIPGQIGDQLVPLGSGTATNLLDISGFHWEWPDGYQAIFDKYQVVSLKIDVYDDSMAGNARARHWVETAGSEEWPGSGPDGFPSGKPGNGGNGGNLRNNAHARYLTPTGSIEIQQVFDGSAGQAGAASTAIPSIPPRMLLHGRDAYAFVEMIVPRLWGFKSIPHRPSIRVTKTAGSDVVRAGKGYDGIQSNSGNPGKSFGDGSEIKCFHPLAIEAVIQYARDAYLAGRRDTARAILEPYQQALEPYRDQGLPPIFPHTTAFKRLRTEITSLLSQMSQNLDYYGNPPGWLPRLSAASNLQLFKAEQQSALKLFYLGYSLEKKWDIAQNQSGMLKENIRALHAGVAAAQESLSSALELLSKNQTEWDALSTSVEKLKGDVRDIHRDVENYAKEKATEQAIFTSVFKIAASVCRIIPIGQPYLGSAGGVFELVGEIDINNSSAVDNAFAFGKGFSTKLATFVTDNKKNIITDAGSELATNIKKAKGSVDATSDEISKINKTIADDFDSKTETLRDSLETQISALEKEAQSLPAEARRKKELKARNFKEELALYKSQKLHESVIGLRKKLATVEQDALTAAERTERENLVGALEKLEEKKAGLEGRSSALETQKESQDQLISTVLGGVERIGKGVGELADGISGLMRPLQPDDPRITTIKERILKSQFKDRLTKIMEDVEKLNSRKQKVAETILRAQNSIAESCATINASLVSAVNLNKQLQRAGDSLDLEVKTYAKSLKKRSQDRLRQYFYHFVKAYEYRFLRRVPDDFFDNSIVEKIVASEQNRQVDLLSENELTTIHKSVLQDKFSELAQDLVTLQQHKKPSMKNKYRSILSPNQLDRLNTDLSLTFNLVSDFNAASIREQDARIISMAIAKLVIVDASPGLNLDIVFKHSGESIILAPDQNYYVFRIGKYPQIVQDGSNKVVWVDDDPISWSIVYNQADSEGSRVSISEQIDDDKLLIRLLGNYTEKSAPLFQEHRPGLLADITLSIDPLRDPQQPRKNFKIKELEFFTFFEKR